jgi:hypothetical protein
MKRVNLPPETFALDSDDLDDLLAILSHVSAYSDDGDDPYDALSLKAARLLSELKL